MSDIEDAANVFAAHLLVPSSFLKKDLEAAGPVDIDDERLIDRLCKRYKVSRGVMAYRLRLYAADHR